MTKKQILKAIRANQRFNDYTLTDIIINAENDIFIKYRGESFKAEIVDKKIKWYNPFFPNTMVFYI